MLTKGFLDSFISKIFLFVLVFPPTILNSIYPQNLSNLITKRGGICFRTDDNRLISKYLEYAALFNNYNQKFTLAINLGIDDKITPDYIDGLRQIQANGHEMMDHTPWHTTNEFSTILSTDYYINHPGVQRIHGNNIELKYVDVNIVAAKRTGYVNINGDIVTSASGIFSGFSESDCYLYFPSLNKLVYSLDWIDQNTVKITDFWRNGVNLGSHQNIQFYNFNFNNVHITVEALKALAEESIRLANYYGLERPYSWIQPGAYSPHVYRNELKQACGNGLGYKSAGVSTDLSLKVFNEYNPNNDKQFGMGWGDFREDIWTLEKCKEFIADRVAKHYVVFGHSHFKELLGNWEGFIDRTEKLIQWCIANNIPIRTYSEWADILYNQIPDPDENIFPSLNVDLDSNNIPDGFNQSRGAVLEKNDGIPTVNDYCYSVNAVGEICSIKNLGGIEKGENEFEIWTKGAPGNFVEITFKVGTQSLVYKFPAENFEWTRYDLTQSINGNTSLSIPEKISRIDVTISCSNYSSGEVKISGIKLAKSLGDDKYLVVLPSQKQEIYAADSTSFSITSNTSWIAVNEEDWLTLSPESGSGNGIITATYSENIDSTQRVGTITVGTITPNGTGINREVTITQAAPPFALMVTPAKRNVEPNGGSTTFSVISNTSWAVINEIDWLTLSPESGSGNGIITATYSENIDTTQRVGTIAVGTITINGAGITRTVSIQQAAKKFLTIFPVDTILSANSGNINLIINSNTDWELKEEFGWIHVDKYIGSNFDTINVNYDANEEIAPREGFISIYGGDDSCIVFLHQNTKTYLFVDPDSQVISADTGRITINVESNTSWRIRDSIFWISAIPDSGSGVASVFLKYDANIDSLTRTGTLFFTGDTLSAKFIFIQEGLETYRVVTLADPLESGTTSGGGSYLSGADVKVMAFPSNGWMFDYWKEDSSVISSDSIYNFVASGTRTLIAKFEKILTVAEDELPENFELYQNYPNPFNPSTTIRYSIPELSFVTLKVYDILGNEVATLIKEEQPVGYYYTSFYTSSLSSGIYFYQLRAGSYIQVKRMIMLK